MGSRRPAGPPGDASVKAADASTRAAGAVAAKAQDPATQAKVKDGIAAGRARGPDDGRADRPGDPRRRDHQGDRPPGEGQREPAPKGSIYRIGEIQVTASLPPGISFSIERVGDADVEARRPAPSTRPRRSWPARRPPTRPPTRPSRSSRSTARSRLRSPSRSPRRRHPWRPRSPRSKPPRPTPPRPEPGRLRPTVADRSPRSRLAGPVRVSRRRRPAPGLRHRRAAARPRRARRQRRARRHRRPRRRGGVAGPPRPAHDPRPGRGLRRSRAARRPPERAATGAPRRMRPGTRPPGRQRGRSREDRQPPPDGDPAASQPCCRGRHRPEVLVHVARCQPGGGEVALPGRRVEGPKRRPESQEGDGHVVQLADERDDPGNQVHRRGEVCRRGEHSGLARPREPRLAGEAPGQAQIARRPVRGAPEPGARKGVTCPVRRGSPASSDSASATGQRARTRHSLKRSSFQGSASLW